MRLALGWQAERKVWSSHVRGGLRGRACSAPPAWRLSNSRVKQQQQGALLVVPLGLALAASAVPPPAMTTRMIPAASNSLRGRSRVRRRPSLASLSSCPITGGFLITKPATFRDSESGPSQPAPTATHVNGPSETASFVFGAWRVHGGSSRSGCLGATATKGPVTTGPSAPPPPLGGLQP